MLIVEVRGTSGSGKSWVIRQAMGAYDGWEKVYLGKKRRPLYYQHPSGILVLGHYETACGGGDSIGSARAIYAVIDSLKSKPEVRVMLVESLLLSEDRKWTYQLVNDGNDVRVLFLTTPVERCIEQIKGRREEAGNEKPLKEDNTRNRVGVIEKARVRLTELGVRCHRCSADQAPGTILRWLRLHAEPGG